MELVVVEDSQPTGSFIIRPIGGDVPKSAADDKKDFYKFMRMKIMLSLFEGRKIFDGQSGFMQVTVRIFPIWIFEQL